MRLRSLDAVLALGVITVALTEGLSLVHGLNRATVSISWAVVAALLVFWRDRFEWSLPSLPASVVGILGTTFFIAVLSPPNGWDAVSYHMSRVMYWIQDGSVAHFPTLTRGLARNPNNSNTNDPGAGVSIDGASPTVTGNVINDNFGGHSFGSGVGFNNSSAVITNNTVSNGEAVGGGIGGTGGSPTVTGNLIFGNQGAISGGGFTCIACAAPVVVGNTIHDNRIFQGGGIGVQAASGGLIANNMIYDNAGELNGGGILVTGCTGIVVTNNTIVGNRSPNGGGIYLYQSPVTVVNNIVTLNTSTRHGDGIGCRDSSGASISRSWMRRP